MANKKDIDDMTVAELQKEADKRGVDVPSDARKADLQEALSSSSSAEGVSSPEKPLNPPLGKGREGIPAPRANVKEDQRLFQTSPDVKEWLTQSEAEGKGFFWRDEKKLGKA